MQRVLAFVLLTLVAACSSSSGGSPPPSGSVTLMQGFDPGPAPDPAKGFQVITPIVDNIAPGASLEYCTDTNVILTEDTWVNASQSFQSETGHHVIFFYLMNHVAPSTHVCTNGEMTDFQFGMPAVSGSKFALPGDLAVKIPKGAQIVVNHHYLNASANKVAQAQSAINVYYADQTVSHTTSSAMIVMDTELTVPVGQSRYTVNCTVNQTYDAWMLIPHMHNWGTHITVTDTPVATGKPEQLFDIDWQPDYAFDLNAVATSKSPSSPFVFNPGDKIQVQCDYLNNTGSEMTFGDEMCLMANFTVDPKNVGNVQCDRGVWGKF